MEQVTKQEETQRIDDLPVDEAQAAEVKGGVIFIPPIPHMGDDPGSF